MKASLLLILALVVFGNSTPAGEAERKKIAFTIDDAPRGDTRHFSGTQRAIELIASLRAANIPGVMFFANTGTRVPFDSDRMKLYAAAGHSIGNHSHTHADLHRVGAQEFAANVAMADQILRTLPGYVKWLRFPYLREGRTVEERDAVRATLKEMGYGSAYVTVDTYDWYMDSLLQGALKESKTVNFSRLGDAYVDLMTDSIEFYDSVARKTLRRSPKHVLLMHENDLAALFVDDLADRLRSRGWEIINAADAFTDPIAAMEPDTLTLGQGRVIGLAVQGGYAGPTRMWEDEAMIRAEFARRRVWD